MAKKSYIMKDLFAKFKAEIQQNGTQSDGSTNSLKWPNPTPGAEYKLRFLPDSTGSAFYKKYFYHMFQIGDKWNFTLCPKTFNYEAYCPVCSVANKLYRSGVEADKAEAGRFKRKEKFAANVFIVHDPRDADKDEDRKCSGKVMLYEFATKLEALIRTNVLDEENGVGAAGFDPTDEGINFILRVTETKAQADGRKWPAYDTSNFARNPSPIAESDEELDKIMSQTIDLTEYLKKQLPNEANVIEALKEENVYDLIAEEYERILARRNMGKPKTTKPALNEDTDSEEPEDNSEVAENSDEAAEQPKKKITAKEDSVLDENLLAELESLNDI